MRILWFSDSPMPAVREAIGFADLGNRGGWVANAAIRLSERDDIELGVVWASSLVPEYTRFKRGNITYYTIPRGGWLESVSRGLTRVPPIRKIWQALSYVPRQSLRQPLSECRRIVDEFKPDLVHVHGTENFYGLLGGTIDAPINVSMQGILAEYVRVFWGSIPWWRRPLFPRELFSHIRMKRNAAREAKIIRQNRYFSGRTHWDRATLLSINPQAKFYSDGARLLRPQFYEPQWSLESCIPHRLYTTATAYPYKGTDTLVDALALIRRNYPDATLHIGGQLPDHGYGAFVRSRIRRHRLEDHVKLLGFLEAEGIVVELQHAHAYVLGSHIENSPNSVAEAQTIGTPCVATSAGGTPSMVEHEVTGLLYKAGDAQELARCINQIFSDDDRTRELGARERAQAHQRGNEERNIDTLIEAYRQILKDSAVWP